jgi:hypothetical protein
MIVQELYGYKALGVNSTTTLSAATTGTSAFGGFLCTTAGNFNLKDASGTDIIPAIGVVVGQFVPAGIACPAGMQVVLSGGAVGTAYFLG